MTSNSQQTSPLILVADDDPFTRLLLRQILRKDGYEVAEAKNGVECLAVYSQQRPAMILLDALMPEMDGFTCCQELQELPYGDVTPVLMVTGLDDQASVDQAFEAGAIDYITKPIHPPVLRRRLRRILEASWAENALRDSEQKYRSLVDNLKEVIFQTDLQGTLTFLNPAWTEITGFAITESLGNNFLDYVVSEDRDRALTHFHHLFTRPQEDCCYQIRHCTQDRGIAQFDVFLRLLIDEKEVPVGVTGTLTDMTEQRRRELYLSIEYHSTRVLSEAVSVETALPQLLETIGTRLNWVRAEYWCLDEKTPQLSCQNIWYSPDSFDPNLSQDCQNFETLTQNLSLQSPNHFPQRVWQDRTPRWLNNLGKEEFVRSECALSIGLSAVFGIPVLAGEERLGVMLFFNNEVQQTDSGLIQTLVAVGNQLGQFIKRKQAETELQRQNRLLQSELNQAAEYVLSLLPTPLIDDHLAIDQQFVPSLALGGDAFDYYWLDADYLAIYLLDVAGHGVKPALLSVSVLNMLRSQSLTHTDFCKPQSVLEGLNNIFQMNDKGEDYFTIWYGVYHRPTRQLAYASAGHPPAVLLTNDTPHPKAKPLGNYNLPIGMFPNMDYRHGTYTVQPQSTLYLFSDGVYEIQMNPTEVWGMDKFAKYLVNTAKHSYSVAQIWQDIQNLNQQQPLEDDFSLLKIQFR